MEKLPLPDDQPVAINALRNKRSALMGELAMHQQECDRIRSEIIHLDVVLKLFDPATDPDQLPALRKRVHRTEWFARGEQTNLLQLTAPSHVLKLVRARARAGSLRQQSRI